MGHGMRRQPVWRKATALVAVARGCPLEHVPAGGDIAGRERF
jgi:hypothetical protein